MESDNTITKVVVVLLITLGVLGAISYFSFRSYEEFTEALDKLYSQPDETILTETILTDVGALESHARAYSLTLNPQDLQVYIHNVEQINRSIDSLYQKGYGTNYQQEVDTLRRLFNEKIKSFENLIDLKVTQSKRDIDRSALQALTKTQETILYDSLLIPTQEITTTTTTRIQSVEGPQNEETEPGFFQKLFGTKKDNNDIVVPVKSEVRKEKTIAYDSAYFAKVDTLITSAKEALKKAETQRRRQSNILTGKELAMVAKDQVIINQLRSIILKINELEEENNKSEKLETFATAKESFVSVIIFAICGGVLAMILIYFVIRDILKGRELQKQLSRAKGRAEHLANVKEEFLANMSHEIRTPLNSIIGFSEQLASSKLDEEQRARLHKVRSSSEHLLILVNDILDYSKIESGKLRLEKIGFKASMVIHESLATLEHLAVNKGIQLKSEIDPVLESLILKGDPIRLKQILINLAGNGVKFTNNGYVKITAGLVSDKTNKVRVKFQVEDTGKGIAPTKIHGIFEGFGQEDTSISRRYGGTGLGLTISKKLVGLLGGKINVESQLGEGSLFTVLLDYEKTQKDEYSGKFDLERVEINLEGRSLLLIDDDSMNHVLLKPSLQRWGLELESCYNGEDGIVKGVNQYYDYILVDLQMPGKDGLAVIRALRTEGSKSKESAIILCTANAMVKNTLPDVLHSIDATLLKPFKEYEVAAILAGIGEMTTHPNDVVVPMETYSLENFKAFAGDDPEVLRQFLISFIETNNEHLQWLSEYFAKHDYVNVGDTAHKMKNTFGQLKAYEVLNQLVKLEKLVDASEPRELIKERITDTHKYSQIIFEMLEKEIKKLSLKV